MATSLDAESARWLGELRGAGPTRDHALARLHAMLHGIARAEAMRRRATLPREVAADLDDLCLQAANDATVAVLAKLDSFQGASRFTTWAYKFAVLEVSVRLRRRAWTTRRVDFDESAWERLADPVGGPERATEAGELLSAVRRLVDTSLTDHQRRVFLAVVGEEIPIDVLAERAGSSRGAIYKTLHDARQRLRAGLAAAGFQEAE